MNNEQVVKEIQNGNKELTLTLWEQVEKFIRLKADERAAAINNKDIADDLYQSGYFALINAVKSYDDSRGMNFIGYLKFHLMSEFDECLGRKTTRTKNEPIHHAISLDVRAYKDDEDTMLGDTIIDPAAAAMFDDFEEADYWQSVRKLLLEAIEALENHQERKLFRYIMSSDTSIIAAARYLGIENAYNCYKQGLFHLKRYLTKDGGRRLREYDLNYRYFQTSLRRFRNTFTSSVEDIAIYELDRWLKYNRNYNN